MKIPAPKQLTTLIKNNVLDNLPFTFRENAKPYNTRRHASKMQEMTRIGK